MRKREENPEEDEVDGELGVREWKERGVQNRDIL